MSCSLGGSLQLCSQGRVRLSNRGSATKRVQKVETGHCKSPFARLAVVRVEALVRRAEAVGHVPFRRCCEGVLIAPLRTRCASAEYFTRIALFTIVGVEALRTRTNALEVSSCRNSQQGYAHFPDIRAFLWGAANRFELGGGSRNIALRRCFSGKHPPQCRPRTPWRWQNLAVRVAVENHRREYCPRGVLAPPFLDKNVAEENDNSRRAQGVGHRLIVRAHDRTMLL